MTEKDALRRKVMEVVGNPDFLEWMDRRHWKFRFPIYQGISYMQEPVEELELTVRSYNCLKRAGFQTVDDLVENINSREDLLRVRNLGRKSADEIMLKLFLYQYAQLSPERKHSYRNKVLSMNE